MLTSDAPLFATASLIRTPSTLFDAEMSSPIATTTSACSTDVSRDGKCSEPNASRSAPAIASVTGPNDESTLATPSPRASSRSSTSSSLVDCPLPRIPTAPGPSRSMIARSAAAACSTTASPSCSNASSPRPIRAARSRSLSRVWS